jgi:hypothetical protein
MKKTMFLAGIAAVALGALPVAAAAEMLSTPAEKSQTSALNASAQTGTYASACTLNGRTPAHPGLTYRHARAGCIARNNSASLKGTSYRASYQGGYHAADHDSGRVYGRMSYAAPAAPPMDTQMHAQVYGQTYGQGAYAQGQMSQGQTAMPENTMRGQFSENEQFSQNGTAGYGAPPRGTYMEGSYGGARFNSDEFVGLRTVDPDRLNGVSVETAAGVSVGRVSDVSLARDGTPSEVEIALNDGRTVRVAQYALRYNPNDRILLTSIDEHHLMAMAGEDRNFRGE